MRVGKQRPKCRPQSSHLGSALATGLGRQDVASPSELPQPAKTMINAVWFDRHPLARIVQCRRVANVLSIGLVVLRCFQCSAGKSEKARSGSRSLTRQSTAFSSLIREVSVKASKAASASFLDRHDSGRPARSSRAPKQYSSVRIDAKLMKKVSLQLLKLSKKYL